MCKLCGTNRPAYVPEVYRGFSMAQAFREAVKDYTGESPCRECCNHGVNSNKDTEAYIIDKLFAKATKDRKEQVKYIAREINTIRKSVCRNIKSIENLNNGSITYRLIISSKQFSINKTFTNIDDAIKERDWRLKKIEEENKTQRKVTIEKHISLTKYNCFKVRIRTKGKYITKTLKTLKEAQTFKAFILKEREMIK